MGVHTTNSWTTNITDDTNEDGRDSQIAGAVCGAAGVLVLAIVIVRFYRRNREKIDINVWRPSSVIVNSTFVTDAPNVGGSEG